MGLMEDGTVIPSNLSVEGTSLSNYERSVYDYSIRLGNVVAVYEITNPINQNKKYLEYSVEC